MSSFERTAKHNDFTVRHSFTTRRRRALYSFTLDDTATEWTANEATNYRERILTYKVPYESTFVGKGTIFTREKQVTNARLAC